MRKILISILFAIIASMLCHAQDDSIYYLMPNEEPIIKKHIDRLEILNNRLNKLGINTEQKNIYFHITRDANSESIYLRTSKSDILGDKSNRRLIVGDNSYPITFDFDYQYATFSPIDSIEAMDSAMTHIYKKDSSLNIALLYINNISLPALPIL